MRLRAWVLAWGLAMGWIAAPGAFAGEAISKLEVQLIWGSNEEKSPDPSHKSVEPATRKKLQNVFKWKHYFEVTRCSISVPDKKSSGKVRLSPKCEIEARSLGGPNIEVKLFGEGKYLVSKRHSFAAGESLVLAADDKEGTAWFVVLNLPKPKPSAASNPPVPKK
jgi:hypothetical protein